MKDKKTAVIVAWRDQWHPKRGGAEVYITKVAQALKDHGYKVVFFTERYKGSKKRETVDDIIYIRKGNAVTLHLYFPQYFRKNLKQNCDVLIENFNAVPFGIPKLHNDHLTVIHHVQNPEWSNLLGKSLGTTVAKYFTNKLIKTYSDSNKIVTVSPSTKEELISLGFNSDKIKVVYNGIEVPITESINKPQDSINILSIGRIKATKHIEEAIEMIKHSVEKGIKNIHLDIAGKGNDEERLKSLVRKYNLEKYVKFWGYISEEKKISLLRNAHLHVQFSRKEGWGITVIEAAASGTPTICYRVPGLVDSVKDSTGYFVDDKLVDTWDLVINDIRNNSGRYRDKQKEGIKWAGNFKWETQMQIFINHLENN
jgi:glycosyltransferase involved in cell wall biosynthesis